MKTKLVRTALALLAAVTLLAGCAELFGPELVVQQADAARAGVFTLKVIDGSAESTGPAGARTLYPSQPAFTHYSLEFMLYTTGTAPNAMVKVPVDGTTAKPDGTIEITGLIPGTYDIEVTAFAEVDLDRSDSIDNGAWADPANLTGEEQVPVAYGKLEGVVITEALNQKPVTLKPIVTAVTPPKGFFKWEIDLSGLDDVNITTSLTGTATLYQYRADGDYAGAGTVMGSTITLSGGDEIGTGTNAAITTTNTIELDPGYYYMEVKLQNSYQTRGRVDVVKVSERLVTKSVYPDPGSPGDFLPLTYVNDDFAPLIALTGTITNAATIATSDGIDQGFELLVTNAGNNIVRKVPFAATDGVSISDLLPATITGDMYLIAKGKIAANPAGKFFALSGAMPVSFPGTAVALGSRTLTLVSATITSPGSLTIDKLVGEAISATNITITTNGTVNQTALSTGVTVDWIKNLPAGVTTTLQSMNGSSIVLQIAGTPTAAARGDLIIELGANAITGVPVPLPVTVSSSHKASILRPLVRGSSYWLTTQGTGAQYGFFELQDNTNDGAAGPNAGTPSTFHITKALPEAVTAQFGGPGDTIKVVPVPAAGFRPKSFRYGQTGTPTSGWTSVNYTATTSDTFAMPNYPVTVEVVFETIPGVTVAFDPTDPNEQNLSLNSGGTPKIGVYNAPAGNPLNYIVFTMTPVAPYHVSQWVLDGVDVTARVKTIIGGAPSTWDTFTLNQAGLLTLFNKTGLDQIELGTHELTAVLSGTTPHSKYINFQISY